MNCRWEKTTIGDVARVVGGGTPSSKVEEYYGGDIPWITPKDLSGYTSKRISVGERSITELGLSKSSAKLLPKDTVLLTSRAPIGYVAIAEEELSTNQGFKSLILKDGYNPDFFYYLLKTLVPELEARATGSTFKEISGGSLKEVEILVPTESIQKRIATILNSLDSKIEVNNQTNQTLEEMAQAIFKSWFVDFDPVKAKMNGEQPEGMDAVTASLFPEKLVESELGLIPEGWELRPIKDLCSKVQNGGTPKRSESSYWDNGDIPWLTSGEVRQSIITSVENRITQLGLDKSSAKWVPELSTLVALYGATAGEVSLTSIPLTTNQAVCALMPKKEHQWYNYLQLKNRVAELAGKAVGSAQQNISKGLVESTEVLSVPESLLEAFNAQVENFFKLRICNLQENVELANLRDTLLPKLLSGEIELETK